MVINIDVLSINSIEPYLNTIEITYEMTLSWIDSRIVYMNTHTDNTTSKKIHIHNLEETLWTPFLNQIHKNSILGEIKNDEVTADSRVEVKYHPKLVNPTSSFEDLEMSGEYGTLHQKMRIKGQYECIFNLFVYPFSHQNCTFNLAFKLVNKPLSIASHSHSIRYLGVAKLGEFEIKEWHVFASEGPEESTVVFSVSLKQLYRQQLTQTHFQTVLLGLLAYLTLYINIRKGINKSKNFRKCESFQDILDN